MVVEGDALALASVAAGATGLLVIALQALGHVVVDYEADVGLVDAHTEGDGGHNHIGPFHQEIVLVCCAGGGVQAGVVGTRLDAVHIEQFCQLLYLLAAQAVDDAALAGIILYELYNLALGLGLFADFIIEIRPVERRLEHPGLCHSQILLDIALDLGSGGGGERYHRRLSDLRHYLVYAAVFRTEVVAPFGDAVRLVYRVEGYRDGLEHRDVLFFGERFGRHVEQFGAA